ncbi:MAG: dihydropteroate synthase [Proteobacteria bacterium]|nr:dihydropteroate synthase [Pseudomonadota bacterium]
MIYLSIGSNLGNRLENLTKAVDLLKNRLFKNLQCSIVLETASILLPGSPKDWDIPFLNMVVWGECSLSPESLLTDLKEIEHEIGRPEVYEKWAPRIIDLDILFIDDVTVNTPNLQIPHPEIGNRPFLQHLLSLINPLKFQYSNIENSFLKNFVISPKLVGIVNVTPDSFSDGGKYFNPELAITKALELANDGATIVELGAQSTRPGAKILTPEEEYGRLKPVLDGLLHHMQRGEIRISIDSFSPSVILQILANYPISWVNDVNGSFDDTTLRTISEKNCGIILMHSLSVPADKTLSIDLKLNPVEFILEWAIKNIERLQILGFDRNTIIIDPGIGFGKSAYQDILLIHDMETFKKLPCKTMVGHSRKFFMTTFTTELAGNRDLETIATSAFLQNKTDYLRVHNVKDHMRFFVAQNCLMSGMYD